MTATRLILGLGITIACFAIAGHRFWWLRRLLGTGAPAPGRWKGFGPRAEAELVEVAGQRKLLAWTVPGLAHFFTMWGFTILLLTIIEAYGALFSRSFHIWFIGTDAWVGFLEDFFTVAVLVSLGVFAVIRLVNSPTRKQRSSRFYGSHTGAAWLILGYIAAVMVTLLMYRAAQVNAGYFPYGHSAWAFASHTVATWLAPLGTTANSAIETTFLILNIAVISSFLVFVVVLEAPAHLPRAHQRRVLTPAARARRARQDPRHGHGERDRGHRLRRGARR